MTTRYSLLPFDLVPLSFNVAASAERQGNVLSLTFSLSGIDHAVIWPERESLQQQDYLWESTCLEAFIQGTGQSQYFELNLAPSLAWNLYHFDGYRTPNLMPPRRADASALAEFSITGRTVHARIDLRSLHLAGQEINIGLTAVIKTQTDLYYLALHHPASQADFHDARGWTITLLPDARFPESVVDNNA